MLLVVLALLAALAGPQSFWGRKGHRIVARVAEARLTPEARAEAGRLLRSPLADASTWADSVRGQRPATAPWHYVNVPMTADGYDRTRDCPELQCIVEAIRAQRRILADRGAPAADRAEALRFVIHFLGDLHQPLHAIGRDHGGNDVRGRFLGREANLHQVWDSGIIEATNLTEDVWVGRLLARLAQEDGAARETGSLEDWTRESLERARDQVYGALPATPDWNETYVASRASIVEDALLAGAVRLARVLNEDLGMTP